MLSIFSLLPHLLFAQYYFDFEKDTLAGTVLCPGEGWEQVPVDRWNCSEEGAIEGVFSLRHAYDNSDQGCDYVVFNHEKIRNSDSVALSFRLRHGYSPSSANNWQVALGAELLSEGGIQSGIVVGVNFTGSDDLVKIWKCEAGSSEVICTSQLNYQEQVGIEHSPEFRLVWYKEGILKIYFALKPSEDEAVLLGTCHLDQFPEGRQLVIRYKYSSARDRKLWMDEIRLDGNFVVDTIAPGVAGVELLGDTSLRIVFSEKVMMPDLTAFRLLPRSDTGEGIHPDTVYVEEEGYVLEFSRAIANRREYEFWISGICDVDGNCMGDTMVILMRNDAVWGDVVFNELMIDPDPPIRLPAEEYLELFKRSTYKLDLTAWRVEVNRRTYYLSDDMMDPSDYVLLKGITLPNEGAVLTLYNKLGTPIHAVEYKVPWDALDWKLDGGWSLESPDPEQLCTISRNWEYSTDPTGGTPGRINSNDSELTDTDPPVGLYLGFEEADMLSIYYSEPIRLMPGDMERIVLIPGGMHPIEAFFSDHLSDKLNLRFAENLQEDRLFTLELPLVSDCQGKQSRKQELKAGTVTDPFYGALLINEIMYNPADGFPEFVELFNPGPDIFDLRDFALHVVDQGANPEHPLALSVHSRLFSPGDYLVITGSVPHLRDAYKLGISGQWLELGKMTVLNNTGGTIYLCDQSGSIVDMASYSEQMHMELLDDTRGISLERISAERPGSDPGNWHSAASIEGYATPGKENSQAVQVNFVNKLLLVSPAVFSPDNDGFQDLLEITISTHTQGYVLRMWISDLHGSLLKSLAHNHIIGPTVKYTWDGEQDTGKMVSEGIYVVHVMIYHPVSGQRMIRKAAIGVVYR